MRIVIRPGDLCTRCKKYPVEVIDEWVSDLCGSCNDREIEKSNEQREWNYFHNNGR